MRRSQHSGERAAGRVAGAAICPKPPGFPAARSPRALASPTLLVMTSCNACSAAFFWPTLMSSSCVTAGRHLLSNPATFSWVCSGGRTARFSAFSGLANWPCPKRDMAGEGPAASAEPGAGRRLRTGSRAAHTLSSSHHQAATRSARAAQALWLRLVRKRALFVVARGAPAHDFRPTKRQPTTLPCAWRRVQGTHGFKRRQAAPHWRCWSPKPLAGLRASVRERWPQNH